MNDTGRALLAAVCNDPADDAARLIYADWLEERDQSGDNERAEFVRVQCELAAWPVEKCDSIWPGCVVDVRRGVVVAHADRCPTNLLREREHELYRYAIDSLKPDGIVVPLVDGKPGAPKIVFGSEIFAPSFTPHFSRGFVSSITCTWADWLRIEGSVYWREVPCGCTDYQIHNWKPAENCPACRGRGTVPPMHDCSMCKGHFYVKRGSPPPWPPELCECHGTGRIPRPCPDTAQPIEEVHVIGETNTFSWRERERIWPGVRFVMPDEAITAT